MPIKRITHPCSCNIHVYICHYEIEKLCLKQFSVTLQWHQGLPDFSVCGRV